MSDVEMVWRDISAAVRGMKRSGLERAALVVSIVVLAVGSSPAVPAGSGHLASGRLTTAGPPSAARAVTAVPANAAATVSFAAPVSNGGSAITGYIVTAYIRGAAPAVKAFNSSATTEVMGALANGQAYVFEVAARNAVGVGPRSKTSAPITVGAPTAPRSATAIPGNASATVRFGASVSNNGSAISGYYVTPYLANVAQTPKAFKPTVTSATLVGLANAKTYTFKVAAKNARGTSTQSSASVTVGAPTAPTQVTDRRSGGAATTRWSAPSTANGSSIIGYKIGVYLAGTFQRDVHFGSTATSETVVGLKSGGAYAFSVAAQNARGFGPSSALSCVLMGAGQADIDAQPAGTRFCLSGTHDWTLTPKSGDTFTGPVVLDGANRRDFAVVAADGVNNVTLSRLEIRNYVAGDARGAIHTPRPPLATGWTLDDLRVHDIGNGTTDGAGAELGVGWRVVGGRYFNTRQEGLTAGGGARDILVDDTELDHNNFTNDSYTTRSHSCGDEAGGFKFVADDVTVRNSKIHDNACKGLWSDLAATNVVLTNNTVYDNWDEGIFVEISGTVKITGNDVFGNGFRNLNGSAGAPCGSWAWGGGITLSTSGRTHTRNDAIDVGHNRVFGNCSGITGADQHRTERHCGVAPLCELANVSVHDNTIGGSTARGAHNMTGAWRDDHDNLAAHNIIFTRNTFTGGAKFCGLAC